MTKVQEALLWAVSILIVTFGLSQAGLDEGVVTGVVMGIIALYIAVSSRRDKRGCAS